MLTIALGLFAVSALIGIAMAIAVFQKRRSLKDVQLLHVGSALAGIVLVVTAAFRGDLRVWLNIGLAVAVLALGIWVGYQRANGLHPKKLVAVHGGLAVLCCLILAYFIFCPSGDSPALSPVPGRIAPRHF